ncbi:MAG TPA: antibiotic biosynthesis monooxygenase [Pyrinomonadaceae bacterium]|nr:antibiotic biosynthesis monooxygenase [Pyrinomonadaceae bacterium]
MALISITRLRIRAWRFLPAFLVYSLLSARQSKRAPGNLGLMLLRDANRAFWTATAWRDEAAMRAFMMSGAHRRAMPKLLDWCDEAALVHWTQETHDLPDWQEAHRRMLADGRRSKVRHPSPAHTAYDIPPPKT